MRYAGSHQFTLAVDPFVKPGDPTSGLVPNIHSGTPGVDGEADKRQQAYNYRICTTDVPERQKARIPQELRRSGTRTLQLFHGYKTPP